MSLGVDLRSQSNPIKDQGRRGTCVSCAATAAHEMIRSEGIELSIEFLHWAAKRRDGLPTVAEGTTLGAAKNALNQDGQPPETMWPYDDRQDQWSAHYQPPRGVVVEAKHHLLTGGDEIVPTGTALRNALDRGQPVVLGIKIHHTWHGVGQDGRIATPPDGTRDLGGHAVVIVGYRGDQFVVQNSWGEDWGDGGMGYLDGDYVAVHGVAAWVLPR